MQIQKKFKKINKILLATQNEILLDGILSIFKRKNTGFEITSTLEKVDYIIDVVEQQPVDIVMIDLSTPSQGAFWAAKEIKHLYKHITVIILLPFANDLYKKMSQDSGADGCIICSTSKENFIHAIRQIASGNFVFLSRQGDIDGASSVLFQAIGQHLKLNANQKKILPYVIYDYASKDIASITKLKLHMVNKYRNIIKQTYEKEISSNLPMIYLLLTKS